MRIGIDCRFILENPTGIGSYTVGLVRALLRIDSENEYVLVVRSGVPSQLQRVLSREVEIVRVPLPPMGLRQKFGAGKYLKPLGLDVYHYPHHDLPLGLEDRGVITLHHFVSMRISTGPGLPGRALLLASIAWSVMRARRVIAVSEYAASLVRRRLGASGKVVAIYPPPSPAMEDSDGPGDLPAALEPGRYFLCVAEWRPHKNLPRLIRAFAGVRRELATWRLAVAGAPYRDDRELVHLVEELGLTGDVLLLGKVDPATLRALYRHAGAFVLVSLLENFGYPVVEAMKWDIPILCSEVGSLPEVADGAALFVDPWSEKEIAAGLLRIATDNGLRSKLRQAARRRVGVFEGTRSARATLALYREVAALRRGAGP